MTPSSPVTEARSGRVAANKGASSAEPQTAAAPPDSEQLRRANLDHANEVRRRRKVLKYKLRHGETRPQVVISAPPSWLRTATLETVLGATRGYGPARILKVCRRAGVDQARELGSLSLAERRAVVIAVVQDQELKRGR